MLTDKMKINVLIDFNEWCGGGLPSHHFWDKDENEDDEMEGKYFWIEDNSHLAGNNEEALEGWFHLLDEDREDKEVKQLIKKYPELKKKIGYIFKK